MIDPLSPEKLRRHCDPDLFPFETTEEIGHDLHIIGQPRGTQAINFGINISSPGYNIFVLGESGTGRTTAIKRFIEEKAQNDPIPDDWVYVFNFPEPHKPISISLPPGMAAILRDNMSSVIEYLRKEVPRAFDTEAFRNAALEAQHKQKDRRDDLFSSLQTRAAKKGAAISAGPEGMQIIPLREGRPVSPNEFEQFTKEEAQAWKETAHDLEHMLNETLYQIRLLERETQEEISQLVRRVAASVVDVAIEELIQEYQEYEEVVDYLEMVKKDIIENIYLFRDEDEENPSPAPKEFLLRRYKVNVLVDHTRSAHAPVIVEFNPTVPRLLGRIEHESHPGGMTMTDFTLVRSGALHESNGGYLVIRAKDLFTEPGAWEALKRVLIGGEIKPDDPAVRGGTATRSLDPEPIPADLKVVLIGPSKVYYSLYDMDEDFQTVFKVMADFDEFMDRTFDNELEYAGFVASLCEEEGLLPFDRTAVARIVEFGSRIADSQKKLTARFGFVADLIREAHYWAMSENRVTVTTEDVLRGVEERIFRSNRISTRIRESMQVGKQLIATEGEVIGQVNGLYVTKIGEHTFGQPTRITARTYVGREGVIQIDREVDLAGPIHNKGVLTLTGYIGGKYADKTPLSFNAQVTFEQNYLGIEGDSASATELYALISSLAEVPVRQSVAVTGSVNQMGVVQAIGGVTQKVEGWFELCNERGLSGSQGVIIPAANVEDLMLRVHILEAVEKGHFHVWAAETIDQGIEILTGLSSVVIHKKAADRLKELADAGSAYYRN